MCVVNMVLVSRWAPAEIKSGANRFFFDSIFKRLMLMVDVTKNCVMSYLLVHMISVLYSDIIDNCLLFLQNLVICVLVNLVYQCNVLIQLQIKSYMMNWELLFSWPFQ